MLWWHRTQDLGRPWHIFCLLHRCCSESPSVCLTEAYIHTGRTPLNTQLCAFKHQNFEVQELKRQEEHDGFVGKPRRPRVIVLSPTRELTEQIAGVARQLSHHAKLRTVALSTGVKYASRSVLYSSVHRPFSDSPVDGCLSEVACGRFLCHG
jgi:hypothetical protein